MFGGFTPHCRENLEEFVRGPFAELESFLVTNRDKIDSEHAFFYDNERITIDELNSLLSCYDCDIVSAKGNYYSDECITVALRIHCGRGGMEASYGGAKKAFAREYRANDMTLEDGFRIQGRKLYCVSLWRKQTRSNFSYYAHQCVSVPEFNHILRSHNAVIEKVIPVYRTGTEAFVLVNFNDLNGAPGDTYDRMICVTEKMRRAENNYLFSEYDVVSAPEHSDLGRVTEIRAENAMHFCDQTAMLYAETVMRKKSRAVAAPDAGAATRRSDRPRNGGAPEARPGTPADGARKRGAADYLIWLLIAAGVIVLVLGLIFLLLIVANYYLVTRDWILAAQTAAQNIIEGVKTIAILGLAVVGVIMLVGTPLNLMEELKYQRKKQAAREAAHRKEIY